MCRIYFYKLTEDNGGAPCVTSDLLSLAICKPMIRKTAKEGDLIFGFGANSLDPHNRLDTHNRLIYVARITEKLSDGKYYNQFTQRDDCIYRFDGDHYEWKPGSLHHGPGDLVHDLGSPATYSRANVLLSKDFRYFGKAGTDEYKSEFPDVCHAVERLGQGHRVHHVPELWCRVKRMADWVWQTNKKMKIGEPTNKASRSVCHRSESCGVA
jgi:hypothetical protein